MLWAMPNEQGRTVDSKSVGSMGIDKDRANSNCKTQLSEEKENDNEK